MIEKAHRFGDQNHLVGIASTPINSVHASNRPAVLFLNSGLQHRVGPYRLYVDLSRKLAVDGFFSMRFDLSGIGDSVFIHDVLDYKEKVKKDVQSAMNYVQEKYNYENFILIGLCSGAVNSHIVGSQDDRVVGVVLLDGFDYRTTDYYARHYISYAINPFKIVLRVYGILSRRVKWIMDGSRIRMEGPNMFEDLTPPKESTSRGFQKMVNRNVKILCVYSGGVYFNHMKQFYAMFKEVRFGKQLQLEYNKNADHTYTSYAERIDLIATIRQWANESFNEKSETCKSSLFN